MTLGVDGVPGIPGTAVSFSGSGGSTRAVDGPRNYRAYTLEAWVKPQVLRGQGIVVHTGCDNPNICWEMNLRIVDLGGGQFRFSNYAYDGSAKGFVGTTAVQAGQWYYVVGTAASNAPIALFVNGNQEAGTYYLEGTPTGPLTYGGFNFSSGRWEIAASAGYNSRDPFPQADFWGVIDEVAVYDHALSTARIQAHFLARANAAPAVTCPPATVVECGTSTNLTAVVSDPEGDAMTVVWTLNGTAIQTNLVPTSSPGAVTNVSISGFFPLGTNILALGVTDGTNVASCTTSVTVVDTAPPVLSQVVAAPTVLWPPNHKLVRVTLRASVSDAAGPAAWSIIGVQCNEPANARGAGNTSPDWSIADADTVYLRAERSGSGNARIYFIHVQATDASGNQSEVQTVTVTVPKSPGRSR